MFKSHGNHQVSFFQKLFYGLGGGGDGIMGGVIFVLAMKIYNWEYGVGAGLVGLALLLPRLWDAVTDPFMGTITDNARTRWGRRRPFIFIGAVITGLLCMAVWSPPAGLGQMGLFFYLVTLSILFFTSYTVFVIPYIAMGFELTTDYDERTSIVSYRVFFTNFVNLTVLSFAYKLCRYKGFGETPVEAVRVVGIIFGILIIAFGIVPAIFCHTKKTESMPKQKRIHMLQAINQAFKNRPYMIVTISGLILIMGIYIVSQLGGFLTLCYVFQGNKDKVANLEVLLSVSFGVTGVLSTVIAPKVTEFFGKRGIALTMNLVLMAAFLGSWFYITPKNPYLQLVYVFLVSPGMTIFLVASSSMMIDTVDLDELRNGVRREGLFASVSTFASKASLALSLGVSGLLVTLSGFNPSLDIQSDRTIFMLRSMYAFLPASFLVIVFVLMYKYPLNKTKIVEIQCELAARKENNELSET